MFVVARLTIMLILIFPDAANAYTGPGLGLGAVGAALGVVGAIFLGLLSLIWYPFKRLLRRLQRGRDDQP